MVTERLYLELIDKIDERLEQAHEAVQKIYGMCAIAGEYRDAREKIKSLASDALSQHQKIADRIRSLKSTRVDPDTYDKGETFESTYEGE